MKKALTYLQYLSDYLRHGDFVSVISSVKYLVNRTSHSKNRIIRTSAGTFYCRENTNDFQFANYYYEWGVKKFILKNINEYSLFIDAGSCVGDYCVLLSKYGLRCIAFEPVPDTYKVLLKNLELNKLSGKVEAFQFGLGNVNKQVRFEIKQVNTGASHIDRDNNPSNPFCEIRTFDAVIAELKIDLHKKILFKLDVEGMEIEALQGTVDFIRKYPHITFIIENTHSEKDRIKEILSKTAEFEFGKVDEFNMLARKIKNFN